MAQELEEKVMVSAIAAIGAHRVLGKDNQLLWHIPEDLKRFKTLTLGHPVIMGRKTFDSIVSSLGKALPGRSNIVITRDVSWSYPDVLVAHSLKEAIAKAKSLDSKEVFIIGGSQIYAEALPFTDRLYLTLIDDEKDGDALFPAYEDLFTRITTDEEHDHEGMKYRWITLERT